MKPGLSLSSLAALACLAGTTTLMTPTEAQACGGTFCDSQAVPVEQTGENILFVHAEGKVEAHIQIQYDPETDADEFAWVVPVLQIPEFAVGSEELFQNLLQGTVPSYGRNYTDECQDFNESSSSSESGWGGSDGTTGGDEGGGSDPTVVYEETVGAYDITVLEGGTVESLMQWLGDNGYQQDPAAEPIIADYLNDGYLFVALKLTTNAEVSEIHPIVLTQNTDEDCIPLKLTAIAAQDDMEVRSFFLGQARTVPTNYMHVLVNPLRIDWANQADNYKEVITMAVDHADADGRAFVTEFAGQSDVVQPVLAHPDADGTTFNDHATPSAVAINLLENWGLMSCDEWSGCSYRSELLKPILDEYMPVPEGVNPWDYYDCPECYEAVANWDVWDGQAFGEKLEERILEPARHANEVLQTYPYLTRLYTTISPHEMTDDPIFDENPDLADVPAVRFANGAMDCDGGTWWTLPGGMQVYSPDLSFPEFPDADPWAMTVEQGTTIGATQVVADMCPQIIESIEAQNSQYNVEGQYGECGINPDASPDPNDPSGIDDGKDAGSCACTSDAPGGQGALALFLFAGLAARRRRRN